MEQTQRPPAIIGIGKNYLEHAKETGMDKPPENPLIFYKNPSAAAKNGENIVIPAQCKTGGP